MEIKARSLDKITSGETVVLDKGLVLSTEEIDHEKLVRCRSVGAGSSLASSDPPSWFSSPRGPPMWRQLVRAAHRLWK